jgi:chromosome segregation protein
LYLSGESEYQLNGKTCRLRDIQDLFAGTGLSGAHYAIIEQGRIGQILSAKPSDRRNLIEEAAGISKFRTRQRAAETRLESAKTNLSRISDIVSEIDKQASALRRQAAKTRRYKLLREEFRILLKRLFAAEGRHYRNSLTNWKTTERSRTHRAPPFRRSREKDEAFRSRTTRRVRRKKISPASPNAFGKRARTRPREPRASLSNRAARRRRKPRAVLSGEIESAERRRDCSPEN